MLIVEMLGFFLGIAGLAACVLVVELRIVSPGTEAIDEEREWIVQCQIEWERHQWLF